MYDVKTDTWSVIASNDEMTGAIWMSAVNFRGTVFAFGGQWQGVDDSASEDVYRLTNNHNVFNWHKNESGLMSKRTQHTSITRGEM